MTFSNLKKIFFPITFPIHSTVRADGIKIKDQTALSVKSDHDLCCLKGLMILPLSPTGINVLVWVTFS